MALSKELFLAILSMDAYNRGYNPGIVGLGGEGSQIGNATILSQSDIGAGTPGVNAGFYAVGYDVGAVSNFTSGEKAISYRGTDQLLPWPWGSA